MAGRFLPISGEIDFSKAAVPVPTTLAQRVQSGEIVPAKTLEDLPDSRIYSRSLDYALAAQLRLVAVEGKFSANKKVFVHEFLRFRDYFEGQEGVRVGVGIRFVIEATITNANVAI